MHSNRTLWAMLVFALAWVVVAGRVEANQILLDRVTFNSATSGRIDIDFDALVGTAAYPQNYPGGPGHYNTSPTGLTVSGVQFVGLGSFGYETYILGPGVASQYLMGTTFNLLGGRTTTDITLPAGITAFGADFGLDGGRTGALTLTVLLRNGGTYSSLLSVTQPSQFFGVVGAEIDRIRLDSGMGGFFPYTLLDDVAFGQTASLPSSLALLLLGMVALGFVRYRSGRSRSR